MENSLNSTKVTLEVVQEFEKSERCPDCGHFVASIFDHVAGCPDDLGDPPSVFYTTKVRGG